MSYRKCKEYGTKGKNKLRTTRNIAKKGFSGMRSSSPASISLYLESDVLRIPFQAILPNVSFNCKKIVIDTMDFNIN